MKRPLIENLGIVGCGRSLHDSEYIPTWQVLGSSWSAKCRGQSSDELARGLVRGLWGVHRFQKNWHILRGKGHYTKWAHEYYQR